MVKIKICLCVLLVVAFTNVNVNADETVPIYTKKGDALSADVLNDLFGRVAAVSDGFESSQDIVGTWSCITYTSRDCSSFGFSPTGGGILATRTQDMVFSCTGNSCQWNAIDFVPFNCQLDNPVYKSSGYELTGNILTTQFGMASVQKVSPTKFIW